MYIKVFRHRIAALIDTIVPEGLKEILHASLGM